MDENLAKIASGRDFICKAKNPSMDIPSHVYIALKNVRISELDTRQIEKVGSALEMMGYDGEIEPEMSVAFLADLAAHEKSKGKRANSTALEKIESVIIVAALMNTHQD